jgi:hypothetical protein
VDSDQADASVRDIIVALGAIQQVLPKEANFRYSAINVTQQHYAYNGVILEQNGRPNISFSVDGEHTVNLFRKIENEFAHAIKQVKLMTGTGNPGFISADYVVGSYTSFMDAYNKYFLYAKYSKDFEQLIEAELEKKTE